jgi:type VI secretion system protein VasI
MTVCRKEPAPLERLDCYDLILAPVQEQGFDGSRVKATYQGESWTRAMEQEKRRTDNSTVLLLTQRPGERPTVIITTPAIGSLPPRPVLMFSCVDNITRMQVALTHPPENDIPVSLVLEGRAFRSHWFVRENGMLLESSRGLPVLKKSNNFLALKR